VAADRHDGARNAAQGRALSEAAVAVQGPPATAPPQRIAAGTHAIAARAAIDWRVAALFLVGLSISIAMLVRSQVGGDQLNLLARGWLLAEHGIWVQYGNPTSAGGKEAGGVTSVLVGLPLMVWRDYRAPVALVLLFHVLAYGLLDRVVRDAGGDRLRLIFCAAYWLNPWRLYYSGYLWNPNYLFLFSAVHLWTALRCHARASFWHSCLQTVAVGFACQLHPSAVVLGVASALLVWGGRLKLHWAGVGLGTALVAASLVPYAAAAWQDPAILPGENGFFGRGLLLVHPLLKGLSMWFRFASLSLSIKILNFDFSPLFATALAIPIEIALKGLNYIVAPLTLVAAVLANRWIATRVRRRRGRDWSAPRVWLQGYVTYVFAAAVVTYAISPTTVMPWQCIAVFHAAVLPLALWATALSRSRVAGAVQRVGIWWTALGLLFAVASAFGSPVYRSSGRHLLAITLAEHPMLHDLGLAWQSDVARGVTGGWQSDVLVDRQP
jgi:hypothetical protein